VFLKCQCNILMNVPSGFANTLGTPMTLDTE
jgi:hypothetical protein